jgi:NDP-sugar pyrophosphorylase family protein
MITKAIILSAGLGTRMGDATKNIPKVMLELKDKPLLLYNIERLKSFGVKEFCLNLHYLPETIKDYFGDGSKFGIKIHYSFEPELLGTSGALNAFRDILTEDFFVIYGDIIGEINIKNWEDFHKSKNSDATLIVHPSSHPEDSDIIQLDENSKITKLIKKPGNRDFGILGNAAWYIVSPKIFNFIPEGKSDFIKDVFPKMIDSGLNLFGYNTDEFLSDVGTPERFARAEKYLNNLSNLSS